MWDESATRTQTDRPAYGWDFFLAHAAPDLEVARSLKQKLDPPARAFLDAVNIRLGDNWDETLSEAQRASLISVIILSPNTKRAYYQREEIAAAIQMAREDPDTHRVVPVYVGAKRLAPAEIPYGLRLKHGLSITGPNDCAAACERLLETLRMMKHYEAKKEVVVAEQQRAVARLTGSGDANSGLLAGVAEVTRFVRPLLRTLLILFVVMMALLVVCLLLPYFEDVRALLAAVFGALCALTLAAMLWLVARSLRIAEQVAQGRINGG